MILIGLTGLAKSGKSTISDYLIKNYNFVEISFAESLKQIVKILFNLNKEEEKYLYDNNYKEVIITRIGYSGRELLQKIDTELFRQKLPEILPIKNIWIDIVANKIKQCVDVNGIVVSDCRFDDEYEFLKNNKFIVYKVLKSNVIKINNHISENGCKYDELILNDGSLNDLYDKVNLLVNIKNTTSNVFKNLSMTSGDSSGIFKNSEAELTPRGFFKKSQDDNFTDKVFNNHHC